MRIAAQPAAHPTQSAALVSVGTQVWIVAGGLRFEVDPGRRDQVLRALGLADATPVTVDDRWINLFDPGEPLRPFTLPGAGGAVLGTTLRAGQVVHPTSMAADDRFLVGTDGSLAPLSPFALRLYRIDTPGDLGDPVDIDPSEIETLPNAQHVAGSETWPHGVPDRLTGDAPCALTVPDGPRARTVLAAIPGTPAAAPTTQDAPGTTVTVEPGTGALVVTSATGDGQSAESTYLIDATGTAYPVADADAVARLGYGHVTPPSLSPGWIALLPAGPELSVTAAGQGLTASRSTTAQDAP
ncbi:type VII secretion protein EccB [Xylanimonas allomyrinae]|uniref:type VII secretion protein EccB n=1 Tax=Xylanimonas allomyrinae TaxID=2509459 RepID=UPI0013A5F677|nr:type VII secretion protein EccB [Xylanimonas allomyrinae]